MLGAHFDSVATRSPGSPSATTAPGANDNASGTAGLLEVARVLSRYRFEATIRFVGFNAEEQGMIGSFPYAADAKKAGINIRGMVNLDMIGFSFAGDDLVAIGNNWLVDLLVANTNAFVPVPLPAVWLLLLPGLVWIAWRRQSPSNHCSGVSRGTPSWI